MLLYGLKTTLIVSVGAAAVGIILGSLVAVVKILPKIVNLRYYLFLSLFLP